MLGNFHGATTVGERGQVVIPIAARKALGLEPGNKLLVFATESHGGLLLVNPERLNQLMERAAARLSHFEQMLQQSAEEEESE